MTVLRTRWSKVSAVIAAFSAVLALTTLAQASPTPSGGAQARQSISAVPVTGVHGVPPDAAMVALHVGVAQGAAPGFITAYPCDQQLPTTSVVNHAPGRLVQSLVMARPAADGTVCLFTQADTDLIIDLVGFVPAGSDLRPLPGPTRIVDTRLSGTVEADEEFRVPIGDVAGVAADASAAMFTITAAGSPATAS